MNERFKHLDERDRKALAGYMDRRLQFVRENATQLAVLAGLGVSRLVQGDDENDAGYAGAAAAVLFGKKGARALLGPSGNSHYEGRLHIEDKGTNVYQGIKKMLGTKKPLTVTDLEYSPALRERGTYNSVTGFFEGGGKAQLDDLHAAVQEHLKKLPEGASASDKIAAEDSFLRTVLRESIGMRAPAAPRAAAQSMSGNAESRYRKMKPAFDAWRARALQPDEQVAARGWQDNAYRVLNGYVRSGWDAAQRAADELVEAGLLTRGQADLAVDSAESNAGLLQSVLNKAIAAGHNVPGLVRRGLAIPAEEAEKLLAAKEVTAQGFMSTSFHEKTPREFAQRRAKQISGVPVMITIEQRTGVPLGVGEGELTLRPGTRFAVEDAMREADGTVQVYLREVGESDVDPEEFFKGAHRERLKSAAIVGGGVLGIGLSQGEEQ